MKMQRIYLVQLADFPEEVIKASSKRNALRVYNTHLRERLSHLHWEGDVKAFLDMGFKVRTLPKDTTYI